MFDTISAFISLAIAVAAYVISKGSLLITILAMVACVMIAKTLKPVFQIKLENKYPPSEVYTLEQENMDVFGLMGMRVIVITEGLFFHTETAADRKFVMDLIDSWADKLSESYPVFKYRYQYVQKRDLPLQKAYAACRNAKGTLKIVYKKWVDTSGINLFGELEDNRDSFSVDDMVTDPRDNTEHRTMIQFVFDPKLPMPDENFR